MKTDDFIAEQAPYLFNTNQTYTNSLRLAPTIPWTSQRHSNDSHFQRIPMKDWKTLETLNWKVERIPTFREFVLYAVSLVMRCSGDYKCLKYLDEHIAPMVTTCNPCLHAFDVIVKVIFLTRVPWCRTSLT